MWLKCPNTIHFSIVDYGVVVRPYIFQKMGLGRSVDQPLCG